MTSITSRCRIESDEWFSPTSGRVHLWVGVCDGLWPLRWPLVTWVCVSTAELCAGHQPQHQTPRAGGPRVPRPEPPHVPPPPPRHRGQTRTPDILAVCVCVCVCVRTNPCSVNVVFNLGNPNPTSKKLKRSFAIATFHEVFVHCIKCRVHIVQVYS